MLLLLVFSSCYKNFSSWQKTTQELFTWTVMNTRAAILAMVIILMARVNVNIFSAETSVVMQRLQAFESLSMPAQKGSDLEIRSSCKFTEYAELEENLVGIRKMWKRKNFSRTSNFYHSNYFDNSLTGQRICERKSFLLQRNLFLAENRLHDSWNI